MVFHLLGFLKNFCPVLMLKLSILLNIDGPYAHSEDALRRPLVLANSCLRRFSVSIDYSKSSVGWLEELVPFLESNLYTSAVEIHSSTIIT